MQAGSITFSTELDNQDLEKELGRLKKKILREEESFGRLRFKKNDLEQQLRAANEALETLRERGKIVDGNLLFDPGDMERIRELQAAVPKIEAEIKKCGEALHNANRELEYSKLRYGEIASAAEKMPDPAVDLQKAVPAPDRLAEAVERERKVLDGLKVQLKDAGELASMAAGKIKKSLSPAFSVVYQRMKPALDRIRAATGKAFQPLRDRIGPDMEYAKESVRIGIDGIREAISSKLLPSMRVFSDGFKIGFGGILDGIKSIPSKIGSLAGKAGGKLSGIASAVGAISPKLGAAAAAAGKAKDAFDKLKNAAVRSARAIGKGFSGTLKTLKKFGSTLLSTAKKSLALAARLNVFSKLSDGLSRKFKRLGSTIKSALVFSVIYKGLSLVREQVGKYLSVNTQFMTALRRLQGVLLTAFQPIYEIVVPALATLINILSRAIATVTQFFASLFGKTAKQAQINAKSLYEQASATEAAGNAAEEASLQMAAFDEINKLDGNKSAGGGGGGAAAETGPLFDFEYEDTPFDSWGASFSAFLDNLLDGIPKLRDAFKKFADWLNDFARKLYDMFTFPGVLDKVKRLGRELAEALNQLVNDIDWYLLGQALGAGLNLALNFLTSFLYAFDWINLGKKLAAFVNGLVHEIDWYEFGRLLWAGFKIALETLAGFIVGLDMPQLAKAASDIILGFFNEMLNTIRRIPWYKIGSQISAFLNNIKWYDVVTSVIRGIQAALRAMQQAIAGFVNMLHWGEIADQIAKAINDSLGNINWRSMGETIGNLFIHIFDFLRQLISQIDWAQTGRDIAAFLNGIDWVELLSGLAGAIAAGINAAVHALGALVAGLDWAQIGTAIGEAFNRLMEDIDWKGVGKLLNDGLLGMIEAASNFLRTLDCGSVGEALTDALKQIDWGTLLLDLCKLIFDLFIVNLKFVFFDLRAVVDIGADIIAGLLDGILQGLADIGTWLKEHLADPIVNWVKEHLGIHSPSTVFAEIGKNLIAGLLQGITNTWHAITDFFSEKIEALKKTLSDAWEDIKKTASEKWSAIKETLGEKWDSIRDAAKAKFEEIRKKVSEAWNNIKTDVPKKWDEIKTALSTAWDKVKTAAGDAFTKVKDAIIEKMNALKTFDWFQTGKAIVDGIVSGLQSIWNTLTSWARDVKNTISDALSGATSRGGSGFGTANRGGGGFSGGRMAAQAVPEIAAYNIPALARGAVIPPNREFLAVLGDQKSGTNIETPLPTMIQAFKQALREAGMSGGSQTLILELEGRELGRAVVKFGGAEYQRIGTKLVEAHT